MSKRGLPLGVQMRHDSHYVEQLSTAGRAIGRTIPIDLIEPNPEQPRTEFGDLTELTASIKEKGVLEPLLVTKSPTERKWMIIAGERRWRASRLAGLSEVPCIEMELDEQGVAEIALIENLQRKDLTVWEEADGLAALKEKFGYTQEDIAKKISKSRSTVTELLTIAGLPQNIRERCREAKITSKSTLLEIARQFDDAGMEDYLNNLGSNQKKKAPAPATRKEADRRPVPPAASGPEPASVFRFSPDDDSFTLEISFADASANTRRGILEALKTTFDAIKENHSG